MNDDRERTPDERFAEAMRDAIRDRAEAKNMIAMPKPEKDAGGDDDGKDNER